MVAHTVVVVDVDGVVSPIEGPTECGDDVVGLPGGPGYFGTMAVSPSLNAALDRIAARDEVTAVWSTSWSKAMRDGMCFPGPGWASTYDADDIDAEADRRLAAEVAAHTRWPISFGKWHYLWAWLTARPQYTHVVWVDDDLAEEDRSPIDDDRWDDRPTRQEVCTAELDLMGIDSLLIAPNRDVGLTRADIATIESFLDTTTPHPH